MRLKLEGSCLKLEDTTPITPKNVANVFIVYGLGSWPQDIDTDFTLGGCLFGGLKLTKTAYPDKYSCSGYSIQFYTSAYHSLPDGSIVGKNVYIFRVDMRSSVHINDKGNDILVLSKGSTQRLNHTLTTETQYSINFTRRGRKFC